MLNHRLLYIVWKIFSWWFRISMNLFPSIPLNGSNPSENSLVDKKFSFFWVMLLQNWLKMLIFHFLMHKISYQYDLRCYKNSLLYKPPEHQGTPKVAICLMIDIFNVVQNFYVLIPQNSPKGCHTSGNIIVWQKFSIFSLVLPQTFSKVLIFHFLILIWS